VEVETFREGKRAEGRREEGGGRWRRRRGGEEEPAGDDEKRVLFRFLDERGSVLGEKKREKVLKLKVEMVGRRKEF